MTLLIVCVIVVTVSSMAALSVYFIRSTETQKSNQLLLLLCETGERNLDYYFASVERSVKKVSAFVENDLNGLETGQLERHVERVREFFDIMANRTTGVLTYYSRIDPAFNDEIRASGTRTWTGRTLWSMR